jgi:hypothetical protein
VFLTPKWNSRSVKRLNIRRRRRQNETRLLRILRRLLWMDVDGTNWDESLFLNQCFLLFSSVQMCSGLQTLKPCKFRSWMPTFRFHCWKFFIHHATLLNVEFDWVLYHTRRPHGQETLADVYKSIRPEELATLAPQHHCDMLDYVGSMVGVLCSCKPALCWNEFWNISPKI